MPKSVKSYKYSTKLNRYGVWAEELGRDCPHCLISAPCLVWVRSTIMSNLLDKAQTYLGDIRTRQIKPVIMWGDDKMHSRPAKSLTLLCFHQLTTLVLVPSKPLFLNDSIETLNDHSKGWWTGAHNINHVSDTGCWGDPWQITTFLCLLSEKTTIANPYHMSGRRDWIN